MSHSSDYWMDEMKFLEAEITKKEDEINAQLLRQNIIKANVERNEMTGEEKLEALFHHLVLPDLFEKMRILEDYLGQCIHEYNDSLETSSDESFSSDDSPPPYTLREEQYSWHHRIVDAFFKLFRFSS